MNKLIIAIAAVSALAGCNSGPKSTTVAEDSPYNQAQRDAVLKPFVPICLQPGESKNVRKCSKIPFIVYRLSNGKEVVGRVFDINLETGALRVTWSMTTNAPIEDFYPNSSKSVPGALTEILNDRPAFESVGEGEYSAMSKAQRAQYDERERKAMGRYGELERLYQEQESITMAR